MNTTKSIFPQIYAALKTETTKISQRVLNEVLELDCIDIIADEQSQVFWYERLPYSDFPAYAYNYLNKYIKRHYNLTYLYEKYPA